MEATSKRIQLLLLTDCLESFAGGAEKQIFELAKRLDKKKYMVRVASLDCQGQASREMIEALGCELVVFRVKRIYGLSGLIQGIKFKRFLMEKRIDIVQTYHFSSDIWGAFWAKLAGVPVVISNRRDMGFWRKPYHAFLYRLVNPWVKKIAVVAKSVKTFVKATEQVADEKIDVIYNGIDLQVSSLQSPVSSLRKELGIHENEIVVMHVANLKLVKGHRYLLEAMAGVVKEVSNIKLVLIGKDELGGALQAQAQRLNIADKILFLGKREDAFGLLGAADICVLPSLSEGMSNAILEYMAAAKPVVATHVGGNPELVEDGYNGMLVPHANAQALEGALLALAKDTSRRRMMGENGRKCVKEKFLISRMIDEYDSLFQNLLGKKRILHLVSSGGLFGAEKVILNLAGYNKEFDSIVGALNNRHNPHFEVAAEAQKLGLSSVIFESKGPFDFGAVWRVKKFIQTHDVDVIHSHNYKSDIIGFLAARLTGKKWIATNHVWHGTDRKLQLYETIDAFILKFADRICAVSKEIKADLAAKGVSSGKISVIDNGIDIAQYDNQRTAFGLKDELNIKSDNVVVTIVGRLSKEKGHEVFLAAAKEVASRHAHVKFLIVGDGLLRAQLQVQADTLGLSNNVIFTGIRQDMPAIYSISDILVNASFIEGLPMTILEAMAAKVAIVAARVGAIPDVINANHNGLLINPGDMKAFAEAVIQLIQNPQKRKDLAQKAYADVCADFSVARMVNQYEKIYSHLLNGCLL